MTVIKIEMCGDWRIDKWSLHPEGICIHTHIQTLSFAAVILVYICAVWTDQEK